MEKMYLVTYYRHNKTTGGNAYKVDFATTDLSEAKKKYHALLGEFIANPTYDYAMVMLTDTFGNKLMAEYWNEPIPEPEPTPEEE